MFRTLTLALALGGSLGLETNESKWPQVWLGYRQQFIVGGKGVTMPYETEEQGVLFHGIEVHLKTSGRCSTFVYPVFVKGFDTTYSASEGGFFRGRCNYEWIGDSIRIAGKYSDVEYVRLTDSTFGFELRVEGSNLLDTKNKVKFNRYSQKVQSRKKP